MTQPAKPLFRPAGIRHQPCQHSARCIAIPIQPVSEKVYSAVKVLCAGLAVFLLTVHAKYSDIATEKVNTSFGARNTWGRAAQKEDLPNGDEDEKESTPHRNFLRVLRVLFSLSVRGVNKTMCKLYLVD